MDDYLSLWNKFVQSGRIEDYMAYRSSCSSEQTQKEYTNAIKYTGLDNQGEYNGRM